MLRQCLTNTAHAARGEQEKKRRENEKQADMDEARNKRMLASTFVMVRNQTGMNRKDFAAWLGIPYRTMQDWERGVSQVPEYVLRLVAYKVLMEKERGNI